MDHISDKTSRLLLEDNGKESVIAVPLSSYNTVRKRLGYEPVKLKNNELYLYTSVETLSPAVNDILDAKPEVTVFHKRLVLSMIPMKQSP